MGRKKELYHLSKNKVPTFWHINTGVRIMDGNESVVQKQPLVIMRAIADEHLFMCPTAWSCSNFVTASFLIKCCFYLERKSVQVFLKPSIQLKTLTHCINLGRCSYQTLITELNPMWKKPHLHLGLLFASTSPLREGGGPARGFSGRLHTWHLTMDR